MKFSSLESLLKVHNQRRAEPRNRFEFSHPNPGVVLDPVFSSAGSKTKRASSISPRYTAFSIRFQAIRRRCVPSSLIQPVPILRHSVSLTPLHLDTNPPAAPFAHEFMGRPSFTDTESGVLGPVGVRVPRMYFRGLLCPWLWLGIGWVGFTWPVG